MRSILVLRGGALGDFIVTLPALALLRERWPAARIELIGNATAAQLAVARGLLDAAHSQHEARWSALYGAAPLPPTLAAWLAEFDLVLNYWPDPDGDLRRRFPIRDGQTFLSGAAMPSRGPAAAHYCEPLRELGLETREYVYALRPLAGPVPRSSAPADSDVRSGITVHPGSGSPRKNWPADRWHALIERLGSPVTLILGEAELDRWSQTSSSGSVAAPNVSSGSGSAVVSLACAPQKPAAESGLHLGNPAFHLINRPLEELVDHLSATRLFLGHDSGISHLAAACGAPCVLLFGPTSPPVWAPPAPSVRIVHSGPAGLAALPVADVAAAVASALSDRT